MFKCGFARVDMTPKLGLHIPGHFAIRPADGVLDTLYARACVMDDGTTVVGIAVLDLIYMSASTVNSIRRRVNEFTGIPEQNITVACTHTHTGPPTDRHKDNGPLNEENTARIIERAADALITAYNNRTDAKVGFGNCEEHNVAYNRRYYMKDGSLRTNPGILNPDVDRPASPIDPEVGVLRFDNADGEPIGAIVNFAVHADVVKGTRYSGDYIGELDRTLKKVYGEDFGVVFMNGCCGDLNHNDVIGGNNLPAGKHHLRMGKILAGDTISTLELILTTDKVTLKAANGSFKGRRRRVTEEDYKWALEVLAKEDATFRDRSYASGYKKMFEEPLADPIVELTDFVLCFDDKYRNGKDYEDVAICSMPGEIFVEIGLALKAESPYKHTMICELANDIFGYISTAKGIELGGYEAKISTYTNMEKETERQLVDTHVAILNGMKG